MNGLLKDDENRYAIAIAQKKEQELAAAPESMLQMQEQRYRDVIKQKIDQEEESLRQSLMVAVDKNPDQAAQIQKLAIANKMPVELVQRNIAVMLRDQRVKDLKESARFSPVLSRQMSDPDFAALAFDDTEKLSMLETLIVKPFDFPRAAVGDFISVGLGAGISGTGELYGVATRKIEGLLDRLLPNSAMSFLRTPIPSYLDPAQTLKTTGGGFKALGDIVGPPKDRRGFFVDVAGAVGQLGGQIALTLINPALSTVTLLGQGADIMAEAVDEDDASQAQKDAAIVSGAAITALTERAGIDLILNKLPPKIRNRTLRYFANVLMGGGIEAAQEVTEGLLHDLARRFLTNEDAPLLEGAMDEASVAAVAGAIVRAALTKRSYQRAAQQQEFFRALGEDSKASKLRERMPDKFQQYIENLTKNGPVKEVYIPVDQFNSYFQSKNENPEQKAAQFGATNYMEASAAGTDIVIPLKDFTTKLAPTDDLQGLFPDLRMEQDGMTAREFEQYKAEEEQRMDQILQDAQQVVGEVQTDTLRTIREEMRQQLIATGYEQSTADAYATVYAKTIDTLSQRAGLDAKTMHDQYSLNVTRPLPEVLSRDRRSDIQLDPLLDRLRKGDLPANQEIFGKSLTDFLIEKGGLRPYGELTDVDLGRGPFQRNLVQEMGMDADTAAQSAVEAGYLQGRDYETVTERDLFDAIDEELSGVAQFSPQQTNEQLLELRDQLENLERFLQELGVDLTQITDNAEVRRLIEAATQSPEIQDVAGELFQAGVAAETQQDQINSLTEMRVSPRLPTAVAATEEIMGEQRLQPDLANSMRDPKQFAKNIGLMLQYPNFKGLEGTPDQQAEAMIAQMVDNLMYLYNGWQPKFRERSRRWYVGGNRIATRWAERFQVMPQQVAGIIAATSPQKDWFQNISIAERILEAVINNSNTPWTPAMSDVLRNRDWGNKLSNELAFTPIEQLQRFEGKTMREMYDPANPEMSLLDMAVWIRAWDEANNPQNARVITPEGAFSADVDVTIKGEPVSLRAQSFGAMVKSIKILTITDPAQISEVIGANHKVRSFYNNIIAPYAGNDVTIDTHAVAAALLRPLGSSDIEVGHNFGSYAANSSITGMYGTYGIYAEAYRRAAAQVGVLPREMQSITWEAVRGLFKPQQKTKKNKQIVDNLWDNVSQGQLEVNDVRNQISELVGGIANPTWSGYDPGSNEATQDSSYETELSEIGVSGRRAGSVGVRAGREPAGAIPSRLAQTGVDRLDEDALNELLMEQGIQPANQLEVDSFWSRGYTMFGFHEMDDSPRRITTKTQLDTYAVDRILGLPPEVTQQFQQEERGFIQFGKDRKFNIKLLERADLSTFLHETGHFYLEVLGDLAQGPAANPQLQDDYATVLDFLGLKSRDELTLDGKDKSSAAYKKAVAAHEKFARANEAYLMEGKAPSVELRQIFQRFKGWLKLIYKDFLRLDVTLTDSIRGVFDRIYATDQEIEVAKSEMAVDPILLDAQSAGMTEAEFATYRETVQQASESAKEALQVKIMREMQRERETWWKAELANVKDQVGKEYDELPAAQAFKLLTETDTKLNKAELVERYGNEYLKRLPRGFQRVYTTGEGVPLDMVAKENNFPTGDALIEGLVGLPNRREYINAEAERRMLERHGDMMTDGSMVDQAKVELHNKFREKVLMTELKALRRKASEVRPFVQAERRQQRETQRELRKAIQIPPASAFRQAAQNMIGQTAVRDIQPNRFLMAERKHGKAAEKALIAGDPSAAADAKQKEVLNHFLYLEAVKAQEQSDKIAEYVRKFEKKSTRDRVNKAGPIYMEQIDAILDGYEFRRIPNRRIDRRASLQAFVEKMEAQARSEEDFSADPIYIPQSVLDDARQINYRQLSYDELQAVNEAVRNIDNVARLKNKLLKIAEKRELDDVVSQAFDQIRSNTKGGLSRTLESALVGERVKRFGKGFMLIHTKFATMAQQMDGWKDDGFFWNLLVRPLNEAASFEAVERAKATKKLSEIFKPYRDTSMVTKKFVPSLGVSMTLEGRLSVALNWGRAENRQRLMDGNGFTSQNINDIFATLDSRDWKFVKDVWEMLDSYFPMIEAQYTKLYGVPPQKSEIIPFQTKEGDMPGGYYPINYDPTKSARAMAQSDTDVLEQMKTGSYVRSMTKNGHTKEVLEHLDRPVKLDFSTIYQHLDTVVHDLSLREYLIDVNKLMNHRFDRTTLKDVIIDSYGDQFYREIVTTLKDVTIGDISAQNAFDQSLGHLRSGVAIMGMGWSLWTGMMQPLGLSQSMVRIGPRWVAKGLAKWGGDIFKLQNTAKMIYEKSPFMQTRYLTQNREINDIRNQIKRQGKFPIARETYGVVEDSYFQLIIQFQKLVDIPTWIGAYEKGLAFGKDEATSIALADQAVLDSQSGGAMKDLSRIQRGSPLLKIWTVFYSYFNTTFNLMRSSIGRTDFKDPVSIGRLAVDVFLTLLAPAIITTLLREAVDISKGTEPSDEEELIDAYIREQIGYILGTVVGVREFASLVDPRFSYAGPAGVRIVAEAQRLAIQISQGELDDALRRSAISVGGILLHYPAGQINRIIDGMLALEDGRTDKPGALIFGAPR